MLIIFLPNYYVKLFLAAFRASDGEQKKGKKKNFFHKHQQCAVVCLCFALYIARFVEHENYML
jgi:hypothetical protein